MSLSTAKLDPISSAEDLAKLCARLRAPFAQPGQVLEEAGVTSAMLERARVKWSVTILSDPVVSEQFQVAYRAERDLLAALKRQQAGGPGSTDE